MTTENFSNVAVGATANDGTGDTLREAFIKVNDNFHRIQETGYNASNIASSGSIAAVSILTDNYKYADGSPMVFGTPTILEANIATTYWPVLASATSGSFANAYVQSAFLSYNAATGAFRAGTVGAASGWSGTLSGAGLLGGVPMAFTAERNGTGLTGNIMAHGGSSTTSLGLRQPYDGKLIVATLSGANITGNVIVDAFHNGVANTSYRMSSLTNSQATVGVTGDFNAAPLQFVAGDTLGWKQTEVPTAANAYSVTFFVKYD